MSGILEFNNKPSFTDVMENDTEFIPLMSTEDMEIMNAEDIPDLLSILPLRNTVLFPGVVIPITIGRDKSIRLIKEQYKTDRIIGVVAQMHSEIEDPSTNDLYTIGTVAQIIKLFQMPDGNTTAILQGKKRLKDKKFKAKVATLKEMAMQITTQSPNIPSEASFAINNIDSPVFLINFIASNLNINLEEKQHLLEVIDIEERANQVLIYLTQIGR